MDPIAQDLLKAVRPELGYKEKGGQHTKFGEWYSANVDHDPQYKTAPWCDMFIAWAAHKAGVQDFVGAFAWTPSHARWFESQGAWSDRPEPGALVFFAWSGSKSIKKIDHVGIVESVEGKKIHTIEANVDRVWLKRKVRDDSKVVGYGLPWKVKANLARDGVPGSDARSAAPEAGRLPSGILPVPVESVPVLGLLAILLGSVLVVVRVRLKRPPAPTSGRHRRPQPPDDPPTPPAAVKRTATRAVGGTTTASPRDRAKAPPLPRPAPRDQIPRRDGDRVGTRTR